MLSACNIQATMLPAPDLKLIAYDLDDPCDQSLWAGTAAHIVHNLRDAGAEVVVSGRHAPKLRRLSKTLQYNYFHRIHKQYFHAERDAFQAKLGGLAGSRALSRIRDADACVAFFPASVAYLETFLPIFLIHDASWSQLLETYPHLSPTRQVPRIVRSGADLERRAYTRKNVYPILTSHWVADRLTREYNLDPQRISILPFGANFNEEPERDFVEEQIERRGQGSCRLLFVGRDWERKRGPFAVEVCEILNARGLPTELTVVGAPPLHAGPHVHFTGLLRKTVPEQKARLSRLYAESDFFLMPSLAEAQGIVFNEAAAYGLPALARDVGGVSAVLDPGWSALFPEDAPATFYADWIGSAFRDRTHYRQLAHAARADYEARLSGPVYAGRLIEIIRSRLDAPSGEL